MDQPRGPARPASAAAPREPGGRIALELRFSGEVWYWRGPAPFYFVTVPRRPSDRIRRIAAAASYGWGMIPVHASIGETTWYTAMFAKDGGYVLPVKAAVRRAENIDDGDVVQVGLAVIESGHPGRR